MERKQGVCAIRRHRSKWETLSVTSYNNIIMVKKRSLPLPPPPYPSPPPLLPVPNKPYGSVDVKHHVYLLMFSVWSRIPPTLSQPYLLIFSVGPASDTVSALFTYVLCPPRIPPTVSQPTYLCFLSAPHTSNTVSALLTYVFCSVPHTSNTVLSLLTYVFCRSRLPPTLSQSYLLMFFSFGPAYLQQSLSLSLFAGCRLSSPAV